MKTDPADIHLMQITKTEPRDLAWRAGTVGLLTLLEAIITSYLFDVWGANPTIVVRAVVRILLISSLAFVVLIWLRREQLLHVWQHGGLTELTYALPTNLLLFAALAVASQGFTQHTAASGTFDVPLYAAYLTLLAATGLSLAWLLAPFGVWQSLLRHYWAEVLVSITIGAAVIVMEDTSSAVLWHDMAGITLNATALVLSLLGAPVSVDFANRVLSVAYFDVTIEPGCSGFEGMALVTAFLTLFLYAFRTSLRFPNALALLPIGMVTIWLLNVLRLAILSLLAAYVSPDMAMKGFHSQAGWLTFLATSCGLMLPATRLPFFSTTSTRPYDRDASDRVMAAFLAPFMALMATHIVIATTAPFGVWLLPLKPLAVLVCLWHFRVEYRRVIQSLDWVAVAVGIAIGIVWSATEPAGPLSDGFKSLSAQPSWVFGTYLVAAIVGSIVLVPVAEELAFRGVLFRWLVSRDFHTVRFDHRSLSALTISAVMFGFLHERWLAGVIAGILFTLIMWRRGRLSDAIVCHVAANGTVIAWALVFAQWSLLNV